jgi:small subunit ribosomal protein S3
MIVDKIMKQKLKDYRIQEYIKNTFGQVAVSGSKLQMTPLGEKVIIYSSRPGMVVGRKGQSIKLLTQNLKKIFKLENPQIEISEVENPNLDADVIAGRIASSLERFGSQRFKGVGHRALSDVMGAGALGVEILVSGKIPSSRAKRWRFYQGYLKKSGDVALTSVRVAYTSAKLKTGVVGIQVRIMPPTTCLPDSIVYKENVDVETLGDIEEVVEVPKKKKKSRSTKRRSTPKKSTKKKEAVVAAEEKVVEKTEKVEAKVEAVAEVKVAAPEGKVAKEGSKKE